MREEGIVEAVESGEASVRIKRHAACLGCRACSLNANGHMTVKAVARSDVRPGDKVSLEVDSASIIKAVILVYLLPAVLFIGGVFLGLKVAGGSSHKEAVSVLVGLAFSAASLILARAYGKKRSASFRARIL